MFQAVTDSRIEALRAQAQGLETLSRELRRLAKDGERARRGATTLDAPESS
jgi:hypothetical protein